VEIRFLILRFLTIEPPEAGQGSLECKQASRLGFGSSGKIDWAPLNQAIEDGMVFE
jgi:hypothetical protein